jgi:hypothetical protein
MSKYILHFYIPLSQHVLVQCFPYFVRHRALFRTEIRHGALSSVAYPGIFFGGFTPEIFSGGWGVQQIQLRTEGRENGDLGAVAPY